jgi:N-methylhydantoinase B
MRNALGSIVDEMYVALMRSAYSTNIKERRDHSTAIFDANGRVAVQGESLPLHLASMLGLVEVVLGKFGRAAIQPGDIFISNDPFVGRGSHLPDIALLAPVFLDGELALFVSNIAHHADVGGMAAGSMAGGMTEIYQEGLRIPPIRLVRGGQIVDDVWDLILLNVRVPSERRGDYLAQIAANKLGVRRCEDLLRKWSIASVAEGVDALIVATATRMRRAIADLPDGEFSFADVIDEDGVGARNIPVCVRITIAGEEITFDLTGSAAQVRGNINNSMSGLQATVLYALKSLIDPEVAPNHGMLDPVRIIAPEGTIVNAVFPAATAGRAQTCQRIIDVIYGALAQAIPERVIAASNGANTSVVFSGTDARGRYYLYMETVGGGAGARAYKDGTDGVQVHITNTSNLPAEALEKEYPLVLERYEFVEDSGGAGTWRGGLGLRRVYRPLDHTAYFSGQAERFVSRPWGLFGGTSGASGSFKIIDREGHETSLNAKAATVAIEQGSVLVVTTPGGGGYGLPEGRSAEWLTDDLRSGKFSTRTLAEHYARAPLPAEPKTATGGE